MGLFWSMQPCPSGPWNVRMVVKNVEQPVLYKLSVYLGHLSLGELHADSSTQHQPFSTLDMERVVMPAGVRRIPVKEGSVRGMLFLPPGEWFLFCFRSTNKRGLVALNGHHLCAGLGLGQYHIIINFFLVHFVVPMGIFPMGNSGRFPQGKPAATFAIPMITLLLQNACKKC